jgi:hypothetical protein
MNGSDIHAISLAPDKAAVATADAFGFVNLFRWPCPIDKAAFNKNKGHSSHVSNLEFSKNV